LKNSDKSSPERRRNQATDLITSGHIGSAVWFLAWPTIINQLVSTAYSIINAIFLGKIPNSTYSLAAIGVSGVILNLQWIISIGLSAGTSALVSRFLGANEHENAEQAARQSIILSVFGGAVAMVPLLLFPRFLVSLVGAKGHVLPLATSYTLIVSLSTIPLFVYMIATAVLRSQGDAKSPLYAGAAVIVLNVIFDWLLIFGVGSIPPLGIKGAAIATGIARIAGMALTLMFIHRSVLGGALSHLNANVEWFKRILNIGWPASIQNLLMGTASAVYMRVLGFLPNGAATSAEAAYTVALRIESLSFMPGLAYSAAAAPLVGQNLGAGKPQRAAHSAWVAAGQATAIMAFVGSLFLIIPRYLAAPFTTDHRVLPIIISYLMINSVSEPFLALNMVFRGALQGAGDTRYPALITFFTMWVVRLPLAWLLALHYRMGATGAWIAMSSSVVLSGISMMVYFKLGNWRNVRV